MNLKFEVNDLNVRPIQGFAQEPIIAIDAELTEGQVDALLAAIEKEKLFRATRRVLN